MAKKNNIYLPADSAAPDGIWVPRKYQLPLWSYLERGGKRGMGVWRRRSGKDELCLAWACVAAHQQVGNYWHMLPEASQARKAVWDAVDPHRGLKRIDSAFPKALRTKTRDHDMLIEFRNGSTWQVVGSDNYDSLVGSTPRGIVYSEYALADPQSWGYLRPILEENNGWALFVTTPRGPNHAKRMFDAAMRNPEWHASLLTAENTGMDEVSLQRIKREYVEDFGQVMGDALFQQEYMCSFEAAILGAVYGSEMAQARKDGRIAEVPYDSAYPVETWWDLGYRDSTAIWFVQRVGPRLHAVDYYESNLAGLDHYAEVLQGRGYVYSRHLAPHDAGKGELGSGKTLIEQAAQLGLKLERQAQTPLMPGINATRPVINRMWFDSKKCERGIDALTNYRYEWDEKRHTMSPKPLHDWASHGADALRTGAMAVEHFREKRKARRKIKRV